jgi:hypothetical protein
VVLKNAVYAGGSPPLFDETTVYTVRSRCLP